MLIKKPSDIKSSEITDEKLYRNRRQFILAASAATAGLALAACKKTPPPTVQTQVPQKLEGIVKSQFTVDEAFEFLWHLCLDSWRRRFFTSGEG